MQAHYEAMLKEGRCWRECKTCPLGKEFLQELYSWSELNPLHPMLAWKVCDPCHYEHKDPAVIIQELGKAKKS